MHPRLQWLRDRADLLPDTDLAEAAVAKQELVSVIRVSEPELLVTGEEERWLHQVSLQLASGPPAARRAAIDSTLAQLRRRLAPDSVTLVVR